ncbi:MAG: MgtC/SapB family protein, partial [Comamonas sp.]
MLEAQKFIQLDSLLNTLISLVAAFVLGALIGLERQYRQRTAGLRTNVLVAVGAAIFVDSAHTISGADGAVRVMAYVVSGIGFLGAGVIMREEGNVRGLNTAATLWGSAAVGAAAGADLIAQAVMGTVLVLSANTLLRPLVNTINRKPLDVESTEVTNAVFVVAERLHQRLAIAMLQDVLEHGGYPPGD